MAIKPAFRLPSLGRQLEIEILSEGLSVKEKQQLFPSTTNTTNLNHARSENQAKVSLKLADLARNASRRSIIIPPQLCFFIPVSRFDSAIPRIQGSGLTKPQVSASFISETLAFGAAQWGTIAASLPTRRKIRPRAQLAVHSVRIALIPEAIRSDHYGRFQPK